MNIHAHYYSVSCAGWLQASTNIHHQIFRENFSQHKNSHNTVMNDFSTPRINASMMTNYQGRNVCLMGMAKDVTGNGTQFTLTTSDNKDVTIIMPDPLNEYVADLTEVHGVVDDRSNIKCQNYLTFAKDVSDSFNMDLYNTAVELMARAPQHYQQGMQRP